MTQPLQLAMPAAKVEGIYRLRKYKAATGELVQDTGEFKNLIVDAGLTRWCTAETFEYGFAGTGTATPTVLDTQLANYLGYSTGGTVSTVNSTSGYPASSPYTQRTYTFRCNPGAVTGNLTEVGVGWATSGTPTGASHRVFSRALIVDGGGTPVTLTVLADEYLDITYTLRLTVPANAADSSYAVTISGVSYSVVSRVANFPGAWGMFGNTAGGSNTGGNATAEAFPSTSTLGAVTAGPSGSGLSYGASGALSTAATASGGTVTRTFSVTAALGEANTAGGIGCLTCRVGQVTMVQTATQYSFSPPIPKNNTKLLTLNFTQTITRV